MYSWNELKISVEGDNHVFMDGIKKYINAIYVHDYEGECDIKTVICSDTEAGLPAIPSDARKLKSMVFTMKEEYRLDIFSSGSRLWYIYRGVAGIWIDYRKNELKVCIKDMPLDFEYYNILIFFLHPLGTILENFGFFRLHSSCAVINGGSALLTGLSGSGKSTAAFCAPIHGGQIIADDLTFVHYDESGYHPSSLTALVKIRNDSMKRFYPELNLLHEAAHYEDETYYYLEDINKIREENDTLRFISILEQTGTPNSGYTKIHPSEIIPQLFPSTIHTSIEENTGRKFVFITDLLNNLPSYKFKFGTDIEAFHDVLSKLISEVGNE